MQRILQSLAIAGSSHIFRQSVDRKTDGIELLAGVQWLSLVIDTPKDTAILRIDKVLDNIVLRPLSHLQVFLEVRGEG